MKYAEIMKRIAEIDAMNPEEMELDELKKVNEERASLEADRAEHEAEGAKIRETRKKVAEDKTLDPVKEFKATEERTMENAIEKRAQKFAETGEMTVDAKETRSILLGTGTLVKPTGVGGINEPQNILSSIVDLVQVEDMTGMGSYSEAYMKSWQEASAKTDGVAQAGSDPVFRSVNIAPFLLSTTTYVSKQLKKQTPLMYEEKVRKGAIIALKKKLANWIVSGNGSTAAFGIYNAVNTEETPESLTQELLVTAATINEKTLRNIVFAHGGDENIGGGAKLFLNKDDLIAFGDVRGTNEKKAVYEITPDGSNPNIGVIKDGGLSVPYVICSDITALSKSTKGAAKIKTMIYGDPAAYKLGLFGGYEVNVSNDYKFAEGLLTVMGEAMVGGNVVVDKGFVVVTLATA